MLRITLHTEDMGTLPEQVGRYFDGFTLLRGLGYWKGKAEPAATVVLLADDTRETHDCVAQLVHDILRENKQESVLVVKDGVQADFIS